MRLFQVHDGKSGTREVAVALLIFWAFTSGYVFFWIGHEVVADYREIYSTLTTACIGFGFGAFGLTKVMENWPASGTPSRARRESDKMGQV